MLHLFLTIAIIPAHTINITPEEMRAGRLQLALERLAECESHNSMSEINVMDGDASSFGKWQFKIKTFVWAGTKYNLPHDDILSEKQQHDIAAAMLKAGMWRRWFNCSVVTGINKFYRYGDK